VNAGDRSLEARDVLSLGVGVEVGVGFVVAFDVQRRYVMPEARETLRHAPHPRRVDIDQDRDSHYFSGTAWSQAD
jgi:hypothetical protein